MLKVWQSLRPFAALRVTGGVVILSLTLSVAKKTSIPTLWGQMNYERLFKNVVPNLLGETIFS